MFDQQEKPYYQHIVIEIFGAKEETGSLERIEEKTRILLKRTALKAIEKISYQFIPQGISLVYILSTSHLAVHTWPESGYLHFDLITCSENKTLKNLDPIIQDIFPQHDFKISRLTY